MRRWIVQALLPALAGAALLVLVLFAGWSARQRLRDGEGISAAFADIVCTPPPHLSREEFLSEVQYLSGSSDRVDLLGGDAPQRVAAAFLRDPWVEAVQRVEIEARRRIKVDLQYRTPVLSVPVEGGKSQRLVDSRGVLLPIVAHPPQLPRLADAPPPAGPPGTRWGAAAVERAARLAACLTPYLDRLCPQGPQRLELRLQGDDLIALGGRGGRVVWGQAPGIEKDGEASAEVKVQRWLALDANASESEVRLDR
jgi:hypothetical protein